MPSLHESVPGQETTSDISRAPFSASPMRWSSFQRGVKLSLAYPSEHEVLLETRSCAPSRETSGEVGQGKELVRKDVPQWKFYIDGEITFLPLCGDIRFSPGVIIRRVAIRGLLPPRSGCSRRGGRRFLRHHSKGRVRD